MARLPPLWEGPLLRIRVAAAVLWFSGLSLAADVQASINKAVNIPAQGLGPALQTLSKERNIHVVYLAEDVKNRQTAGAIGELTVDEALTKLLEGTGMTYQRIDDETISI